MKVFISCDIEGVSGVVVAGPQTSPEGKDYGRARDLMTGEVNAAIRGALKAGATEIVVNDSHGPMTNILIEKIHPAATLITGSPKPLSMMQGIDRGFDAAIFVGYHAKMGEVGILSHTYAGVSVANIWVNDIPVGETGINAGVAGYFGVPVVLVTGDDVVAEEAKSLLPHVHTAVVKWAITRTAARCLPPEKACETIEEATYRALTSLDKAKPWLPEPPVTFKIEFKDSGQACSAGLMPYTKMVDGRTLTFTAEDYLTAFKGLRAMIALAGR
ncbi:MAG TPA: M55 family metallopeptidase [Firmicutes bacterium]|nr:M55 family metallopeptidase [Candidatus Fermentithermobacillaceae bacterium]